MLDRISQTVSNGRTHFLGLASAPLSDTVRGQIEALGQVQWVGNIYEAAAEFTLSRHPYRALLIDLRALARPEVDALLALSRRTGLPVWLLPVDAGRTRITAALAGGALPWPQLPRQFETHDLPPGMPVPVAISKAAPTAAAILATRLSEILAVEPALEIPRNGHVVPMTQQNPPPKIASSNNAPSTPPDSPAPVAHRSPLQGLPARLFEAAPTKSENVLPSNIPQNQVTLPPPSQYDEISPVLSAEELRALLGPPE